MTCQYGRLKLQSFMPRFEMNLEFYMFQFSERDQF